MQELNLENEQRKQIRKIANDWRKGKLTARKLHERLRDIEGWSEYRQQILEELDRAASEPVPHPLKKYAPVSAAAVLGLALIAAIALIAPRLRASTEETGKNQKTSIAQVSSTPTITLSPKPTHTSTPTSPTPTSTSTPTFSPTPSPTATFSPEPPPTHTPTPSPTPVPPSPTPALSVSGVVKVEGAGQQELLSQVILELIPESGGTPTPQATDSPDEGGNFALQAQESQGLAYRLEVEVPSGTYVKEITPGDSDWQPITHTITGLTIGLRSKEPINQATISSVQIALSAVPEISLEEIKGEYIPKSLRQFDPYDKDTEDHSKGDVVGPVTVLGRWVNSENTWLWHLVCCQEIRATETTTYEHFWAHRSENYGVSVPLEYTGTLPFIYFSTQFSIDESLEELGWTDEQVDGLTVVSSRQLANSQPITLEWRIEGPQGWFRLEAWAPRGSQEATYQVFVVADDKREVPIEPLAGAQIVPEVSESENSFKDIGTYHLAQESVLVVRLEAQVEGVKAAFIRVIKPKN